MRVRPCPKKPRPHQQKGKINVYFLHVSIREQDSVSETVFDFGNVYFQSASTECLWWVQEELHCWDGLHDSHLAFISLVPIGSLSPPGCLDFGWKLACRYWYQAEIGSQTYLWFAYEGYTGYKNMRVILGGRFNPEFRWCLFKWMCMRGVVRCWVFLKQTVLLWVNCTQYSVLLWVNSFEFCFLSALYQAVAWARD